eukprot:CAMPEP_0181297846 /NCGR_PEP_ID=MMETSP1101-20121128/5464_1 /TAXON_ID=46948 /ORGANISM="Rhodomonas abbreviata, Strain Caron Lab Isolate" /LENGTH=356 /DNA_ID=CAMNT_0023402823 /DNA_START=149 /DNA_END=1216 /DNA_ORIENTATION=-
MKGLFGIGKSSEPDSAQVQEARERWNSSSAEYTTLKKLLDKAARHLDQFDNLQDHFFMTWFLCDSRVIRNLELCYDAVADMCEFVCKAVSAVADQISAMAGNADGARASILFSVAEGERAVANNMWRLCPVIDDTLVPAINAAIERKPEELQACKEIYKQRKKDLAKGRKVKAGEQGDAQNSDTLAALASSADVAGTDLGRMLDSVREERSVEVMQALVTTLRMHSALEAATLATLQECVPRATRAGKTLGLVEMVLPGSSISEPTDARHVGGAGISRLHGQNNIDVRDGKGAALASERVLQMAFPTRGSDEVLQKRKEGEEEDEQDGSSSDSSEEGAPPVPSQPRTSLVPAVAPP